MERTCIVTRVSLIMSSHHNYDQLMAGEMFVLKVVEVNHFTVWHSHHECFLVKNSSEFFSSSRLATKVDLDLFETHRGMQILQFLLAFLGCCLLLCFFFLLTHLSSFSLCAFHWFFSIGRFTLAHEHKHANSN